MKSSLSVIAAPTPPSSSANVTALGTMFLSFSPHLRLFFLWGTTLSILGFMGVVVWRPFAERVVLHNSVTLALLGMGCLFICLAIFQVRDARDWAHTAVHMVILGFLLRSIPVLLLGYPAVNDAYYYFISTLNLVEGRAATTAFEAWYGDVDRQLSWPLLQIYTVQFAIWMGVPLEALWKFLPPAIGSLSFLTLSILTYHAFTDWRIASVAGMIGSLSDLVVFYQSEYHPQGLGIVLISFLTYLVLNSKRDDALGVRVVLVTAGVAFLFCHHTSSFIGAFLFGSTFIVLSLGLPVIKNALRFIKLPSVLSGLSRLIHEIIKEGSEVKRFAIIVTAICVAGLTIHLFISVDIISIATNRLSGSTPRAGGSPRSTGDSVAWIERLRWGKFIFLSLGMLGVALALRNVSTVVIFLQTFVLIDTVVVYVSPYLMSAITLRFMAFWFVITSIFAALSLVQITGIRLFDIPVGKIGATFLAVIYIFLGILNSQVPAYFLDGLPRSTGVWYGNIRPDLERVALAGNWISEHIPEGATFASDFSTNISVFFYAHQPSWRIAYDEWGHHMYCYADYFVIDYDVSVGDYARPLIHINYRDHERIYDNGSIAIFRHVPDILCQPTFYGAQNLVHMLSKM